MLKRPFRKLPLIYFSLFPPSPLLHDASSDLDVVVKIFSFHHLYFNVAWRRQWAVTCCLLGELWALNYGNRQSRGQEAEILHLVIGETMKDSSVWGMSFYFVSFRSFFFLCACVRAFISRSVFTSLLFKM